MVKGDFVLAFRKKYKLSQAALGAMLGASRNTISRWETNVWPVPTYVPLALAELGRRITRAREEDEESENEIM